MVCIRKDVEVSAQAKLIHTDPNGRHISIRLQTGGSRLLLMGTYWPAGHDHAALKERAYMEQTLIKIINSCSPCVPLMMGDTNATFYDSGQATAPTSRTPSIVPSYQGWGSLLWALLTAVSPDHGRISIACLPAHTVELLHMATAVSTTSCSPQPLHTTAEKQQPATWGALVTTPLSLPHYPRQCSS